METKNKISGTSFRVPPDLLKRLRVACAERDVSQSAVVIEGIQNWLDPAAKPLPVPRQVQPEFRKWHDMLADILASGDKEAIDAIQYNLRVFHRVKKAVAVKK